MYDSDYISHHGIKGMKWGVRRSRDQLARARGSRRDSWSDDAKEVRNIKKKKVSQMSNAELRKYNERTRLEQEYSRLNPSVVKKGWKYVAGAAVATNTVVNLYNNSDKLVKIGKPVVERMLKKKVNTDG